MSHPIHKVRSFKITGPYTLGIAFEDGSQRNINFEDILAGQLFGPLRELSLFNQVRLDLEAQTLIWPNGADFDPATLHDWARQKPALLALAAKWDSGDLNPAPLQPDFTSK